MPPGGPIFDAHLHIIDPRFPLVPNQGYVPEPFTVRDYLDRTAGIGVGAPGTGDAGSAVGVTGGAVVSASFQGFDQSYLTAALAALGPRFVGVTQLPATVSDGEILRLHEAGFVVYVSTFTGVARRHPRSWNTLAGACTTSRGGMSSCTWTRSTCPT